MVLDSPYVSSSLLLILFCLTSTSKCLLDFLVSKIFSSTLTQFIIPRLKPYTFSSLMAFPLQSIMILKIPHCNIFYTSTSSCPLKYFLTFHHLLFSPLSLIIIDSQVQNNNYVFCKPLQLFCVSLAES